MAVVTKALRGRGEDVMRASTMAEFWTRAGELRESWLVGLTVIWYYEHGEASFDGSKWSFELAEEVRK